MSLPGIILCVFLSTSAGRADQPQNPNDPQTMLLEFELKERQVVEAAAKKRTTVQQASAIVTVITAQEIRDRGYRTINDVLQTIPGFEGDRWEFNGWFKETLTRGLPRTVLVLLDGVNLVEPTRNTASLDRKIPLDIVKRIEVTSGPGSVLWGSNALLGVVNIVTFDGRTQPGFQVRVGGGDGPGALGSLKLHTSYGNTFFKDWFAIYVGATYYTTMGPELFVSEQKIIGPLPRPATDGTTLLLPRDLTVKPVKRDHYLNVAGNVSMGPISLGWNTGMNIEHREIAAGGAILSQDYRTNPSGGTDGDLVTRSSNPIHNLRIRYSDRFGGQRFGINALLHYTSWTLDEDPFGVFPRSDVLPSGAKIGLTSEGIYRTGLTVDFDNFLPGKHHLLYGVEVLGEITGAVNLTSFDPSTEVGAQPEDCASPFSWNPQRDRLRPCSITQNVLSPSERVIAAVYATDEWRIGQRFSVNLGFRGQFSSTYDPTLLISSGFVAGLTDDIFLKVNYGEGFRPPDFQSTSINSGIVSDVTFQANPDLDVEQSRSAEVEVNARLFENQRPLKQWYLRANYSYTRMTGIITNVAGRFKNSGDRDINSLELLTKLNFFGGHELWLSYSFVDVVDSEIGSLRNIANHMFNVGGMVRLFDDRLRLSTVFTLRGALEDLNRPASRGFSIGSALTTVEATAVAPTGVVVTKMNPVALLRVGIGAPRLFGFLDLDTWVYNTLNVRYGDPDYFFDDRVASQPQPKPGISFFVEASARW
jgi:outer membrane receptor protein involved in Fe transport